MVRSRAAPSPVLSMNDLQRTFQFELLAGRVHLFDHPYARARGARRHRARRREPTGARRRRRAAADGRTMVRSTSPRSADFHFADSGSGRRVSYFLASHARASRAATPPIPFLGFCRQPRAAGGARRRPRCEATPSKPMAARAPDLPLWLARPLGGAGDFFFME
jgi:hypothetical protein